MATDSDDELAAMVAVKDALTPLDQPTRGRVLRWATERFEIPVPSSPRTSVTRPQGEPEQPVRAVEDLASFYHSASPRTDMDKVLVVSFWLQKNEGLTDVDAFRVNSELRQLGFGVGNVTRAFDKLMTMRPQLVMQTRKAGTSKQARKKYRVTDIGLRTVERMLQGQSSEMDEDEGEP